MPRPFRPGAVALALAIASHAFHVAVAANTSQVATAIADPRALSGQSLFYNRPDCPPPPPPEPCFNCLLPANNCGQFAECNEYNGQCICPPGFGGQDCLTPLCGSLADGQQRYPRKGDDCECDEGWTGINCNVCKTDKACDALLDPELRGNATCYKGGATVKQSYQQCDVTNRKIMDMLPDKPPQVTFSCDAEDETCNFQFWIGKVESFYCALDNCTSSIDIGFESNATKYECGHVKCSCVPGKMLCGEAGSIDISDFLVEEIKGPGSFSCKTGRDCRFEEPAMDQLINDVFGDSYITLACDSGECMHYTQVPGYQSPPVKPPNRTWVAVSAAAAGAVFLIASAMVWYMGRASKHPEGFGHIRLPEDEAAKLMSEHVPAALHFADVSYVLPGDRVVLDRISGSVKPGQVMAIMGASGAGKSTFLDILARKSKRGAVNGRVLVNGRTISNSDFKRVVGFVDQEDTLMPTLTVYETVLYSALLRLPRDMSLEAKKFRTLETMHELGILGIKDSRIGDSGHRGISGGEKRRVSIACELVTSPSILFLDEPTSGLDAYNAYNVVESLVSLARDYRRTVVFTIHQPRSNIVALFDQLVLLAEGKMIYSGEFSKCQQYFEDIGHPCPSGFNIADYLIDLTMRATHDLPTSGRSSSPFESLDGTTAVPASVGTRDEELGMGSGSNHAGASAEADGMGAAVYPGSPDDTELRDRSGSDGSGSEGSNSASAKLRRKSIRLASGIKAAFSGSRSGTKPLAPKLASLVDSFAASSIVTDLRAEMAAYTTATGSAAYNANFSARSSDGRGEGDGVGEDGGAAIDLAETGGNSDLPDVSGEAKALRGYKRASWWTQFRILSGRAFKNLYRNPMLMLSHYAISIVLALFCGFLFSNVTNDIAGFQNRMGLFFFLLAFLGLSCLTSLGLFASERTLFLRERANGYYSPVTYFTSKVLFDILPLRVVPPFVLGSIVYGLVGLVPAVASFWRFILVLVLFNLSASSVVLFISIAFADMGVANLTGSLVMLFNILFAGLLINRDSLHPAVRWVQTVSFFHAAFEALLVNELRYLQLKEHKFGLEIDIPSSAILSTFGFNAQAFWWPDIGLLGIVFGAFIVASLVWLSAFVREKR